VFAATIDQVNLGIWAVQEKYFRSFFVLVKAGDVPIPVFSRRLSYRRPAAHQPESRRMSIDSSAAGGNWESSSRMPV
jgi:hypothetical protein